jgi:fatty acid desaturase
MFDDALDDAAAVAAPDGYVPPLSLCRDERDRRRYLFLTRMYAYSLYAVLAAALFRVIPVWVLALAVPFIYLRMALALHELLHVCPPSQAPRFHQLTMIFESPMCLGYREHRAIHFAHHRFASTDRDPEQYQIEGGAVRAFANAMISPERGFIRWVREHGLSRSLAIDASMRCVAFIVLSVINPAVFFVYWLSLRVSVGFASFVFHHVLHNVDGELGTFRLPAPDPIVRAARLLFGQEPMLILTEHERHHQWPRVRAKDLPFLPEPRA